MKTKGRPPFGSPAQPSPVEEAGEGAAATTGKEELFIFLTFFHPFPRIAREMASFLLLEVPGCSQVEREIVEAATISIVSITRFQNFIFTSKEENASKAIDLMTIDFESKKPLEVIFYGFQIMCWWMRQNNHYLVVSTYITL
ncbi:hypothetical protein Taro_037024 [Colocasia esculenta]|uniref:Uncharacterized protein n=1 Tax=Colocasia esculenta TaxID=4460 RepID=A0A843W4M3_COLES|nr:hypothetical protein [Colocasia esculenta]